MPLHQASSLPGSSPHTRDKYLASLGLRRSERIIPAYAGQMFIRTSRLHLSQDHPRIRGTNNSQPLDHAKIAGSSPHTRDKFCKLVFLSSLQGIIPAYAGQIMVPFHFPDLQWDHPRIRGTNLRFWGLIICLWGSSPHTRDK